MNPAIAAGQWVSADYTRMAYLLEATLSLIYIPAVRRPVDDATALTRRSGHAASSWAVGPKPGRVSLCAALGGQLRPAAICAARRKGVCRRK